MWWRHTSKGSSPPTGSTSIKGSTSLSQVMAYRTVSKTALSNFEARLGLQVMLAMHLLSWTTTPWTLPNNLALCVNANLFYAKEQAPIPIITLLCRSKIAEKWVLCPRNEFINHCAWLCINQVLKT